MSLVLECVLIMLTLTPVKSYTFQIILFHLQLYTYFFGHLTQSCLASPYIPKSTSPLGMKLAFLAQKIFLDLVSLSFAGQTLLRIPSTMGRDEGRECQRGGLGESVVRIICSNPFF